MVILTKQLLKDNEKAAEKQADKEWANAVKTRDKWCCCICGSIYKPNAHHIIPREHKQYKYSLDNGITLCNNHHKFSRIISSHNNPLAFFMWLEKYKFNEYMMARLRQADILKENGVVI